MADDSFFGDDKEIVYKGNKAYRQAPDGTLTREPSKDLPDESGPAAAKQNNRLGTVTRNGVQYERWETPDGKLFFINTDTNERIDTLPPAKETKPETAFERMSRQLRELQGTPAGQDIGAGSNVPGPPRTGMSNVGGVDVPGQLARTPGGATVDLLRPETLNATTLGYDPAQILWAHGIRPSGDPRKDAEAALAVMSEREAYKERYPDETPAEIQQRIAGPRYNPRAAQAAGEAAMRKAAGLENKPRRANALGEMEEWYDPSDYGFAEGTGDTPIVVNPKPEWQVAYERAQAAQSGERPFGPGNELVSGFRPPTAGYGLPAPVAVEVAPEWRSIEEIRGTEYRNQDEMDRYRAWMDEQRKKEGSVQRAAAAGQVAAAAPAAATSVPRMPASLSAPYARVQGFAGGGVVLADPGANPRPELTHQESIAQGLRALETAFGTPAQRARRYAEQQERDLAAQLRGPPTPGMVWGVVSNQGPMGTRFGWTWPLGSQQYIQPYQQTQPSYPTNPMFTVGEDGTGDYWRSAPRDPDLPTGFAGGGQMVLGEPSTIRGSITGTDYASLAEPDPMTGAPRPEALEITPLAQQGAQVPQMPGVQAPQMGQMNQRMQDMLMLQMMVSNAMSSLKMPRRVSRQALA